MPGDSPEDRPEEEVIDFEEQMTWWSPPKDSEDSNYDPDTQSDTVSQHHQQLFS